MHGGSSSTNVCPAVLVRLLAAACVTLAGCGGPALVRETQTLESSEPLAEAKDERILASIETVILGAPGRQWDEYLIRIRALSDESVEIREVAIFDALDHRIDPRSDPAGVKDVMHYVPPDPRLLAVSVAVPVVGVGYVALLIAGKAAINSNIKRRSTTLPLAVAPGAEASVDLFFPQAPLSGCIQVVYADRHGEHRLDIDTRQALMKLMPPTLVSRFDPEFPDEARREGIKRGWVKAQLTLDKQGRVQAVEVIESWPRHIFDEEASRTFQSWTYTEGREDGRTVVAILQFKR